MSVPPPHPAPGATHETAYSRPLTHAEWREWADAAVLEIRQAWVFGIYCPADPELRRHVEKVLLNLDAVSELLRDTLAAMDRAEQSPFPLEIHLAPPADAAHDPSPGEPVTSAPSTAPRKAHPAQW